MSDANPYVQPSPHHSRQIKEVYWQDARVKYSSVSSPTPNFGSLKFLKNFRDQHERAVIQQREAEKLRKCLPPQSTIIACHEQGKEFDSVSFAKFLAEKSQHGDELTFIIGGPLGLHQSILDLATVQLSLSKLTFPHQLVRIILLEQLYRAGTIIGGKQYHY